MAKEYKIKFKIPNDYNPSSILNSLPSPISSTMTEIYNYSVNEDGFYLLDNLVDQSVVSLAMKLFVDEALQYSDSITIQKV